MKCNNAALGGVARLLPPVRYILINNSELNSYRETFSLARNEFSRMGTLEKLEHYVQPVHAMADTFFKGASRNKVISKPN